MNGAPEVADTAEGTLVEICRILRKTEGLVRNLPDRMRKRLGDAFDAFLGHWLRSSVEYLDPQTLDDVRSFDPALQGAALVHLITRYCEGRPKNADEIRRMDLWAEWLYDWDLQGHVAAMLANPSVCNVPTVIQWLSENVPNE